MRRGAITTGLVLAVLGAPLVAYAVESTSGDYQVNQQLNSGGGTSTSNDYQLFSGLGYTPSNTPIQSEEEEPQVESFCFDCGTDMTPEFVTLDPFPPQQGGDTAPTPGGTTVPGTQSGADAPASASQTGLERLALVGGTAQAWVTGILAAIAGAVANALEAVVESAGVNETLAIATTVSTIALAAVPAAAGLGTAVPVAQPLAYAFNFMFGWVKRRRGYGRVYDAATGKPVAGATVRLLAEGGSERFAAGKLLASTVTEADGSYHFTVEPGSYRLEVVANEYAFPSTASALDYHGEHLVVARGGTFHPDIPLDGRTVEAAARRQALLRTGRFIQLLRLPLMGLGSISAVYFALTRGATIDYVVIAGYTILWLLEYASVRQVRGEAKVVAASKPVDSAIVRLYTGNGELVNTVVTQPNGQFAMFAPAGEYRLVTFKEGHERSERAVKLPYATQIFGTIRLHQA